MKRQKGFSLIELMMVMVILTLVMGVILQQIVSVQRRYKVEEVRADIFSEGREFMDQFVRDMHQAGYPGIKMYQGGVLAATAENDSRLAVGIVSAAPNDLWLEGDVDGDGVVDSVHYTLCNSAGVCGGAVGGTCPCRVQRSQVVKLNGTAPWLQPSSYNTEVNGVINSAGLGAAGAALPIAGVSALPTGAGGAFVNQNDDVLFGNMKAQPLFSYYNTTGTLVAMNTNISGGAGQTAIASIRSVNITLNLLAGVADGQTGWKPYVTLSAIAKATNCSRYAVGC